MAVGTNTRGADAAPASQCGRIDQIDALRGIAILGILFLNLPPAATSIAAAFDFPPLAGWDNADRFSWWLLTVGIEGTQRGLLQFLFGASAIILTTKAMSDDGPVAVADTYYRRNLWLMVFGLLNIFILLFPGDILFIYAVAALFLFPFRRLDPKLLLALGLSWTVISAGIGAYKYVERSELLTAAAGLENGGASGAPEATAGKAVAEALQAARKDVTPDQQFIAADRSARLGSFAGYARMMHEFWLERARSLEVFFDAIPEAFCAMLIGAALFKWRVLQGLRSRRFYLTVGAFAYAFGLALRAVAADEQIAATIEPRLGWIFDEAARLSTTLGHVCLISLIFSSAIGRRVLAPFRAAGKMAFTLYVMQTVLIMWILFPAFGLGLWGKLSWSGMASVALLIMAAQLLIANLWLRAFSIGPVEWLWRSLVQMSPQSMRRQGGQPT